MDTEGTHKNWLEDKRVDDKYYDVSNRLRKEGRGLTSIKDTGVGNINKSNNYLW